jgi:hypothetical protein
MYIHFIFNSIFNPCEYSYDKCHRLSFLMFQTRFVYFIGHFETKTTYFFLRKSVKILPVNIRLLNVCPQKGNCKGTYYSKSLRKMLQSEPSLYFGPWGITELFLGKILRFYGKITENWKKCIIILMSSVF